ncbi:MAG: hypothetical protein JWR22_318 [Herminiimonas sp.]|nr:hypothetical protein [Herminiimonas sp.]
MRVFSPPQPTSIRRITPVYGHSRFAKGEYLFPACETIVRPTRSYFSDYMTLKRSTQPMLKPQDLLVSLKIAVHADREHTFSGLASELFMSASEVHASVRRAETSRFLSRAGTVVRAIRSSLEEFIVHGVQYAFPPLLGSLTRGMVTGFAGPVLAVHFMSGDGLPPVWPDPEGETRGISLQPLYPSVPRACRIDQKLYDVLTLVDALRAGSAREREISSKLLLEHLK